MRPEHWLYTIPLRLRSLFRWAQADQELDEELRDHLERKTEEYVAQGMTQEEARRRARIDLRGHCGFAAGNQSLKFKVDENLFSVVNPSSSKTALLSCPFASLTSSLARSSKSKTAEVKREADLAVGTTRRAHARCKRFRTCVV